MTTISIKRQTESDGVVRLAVIGAVDMATCDLLVAAIRDAISAGQVAELVLDLHQVTFLDTSGIAALLDGHRLATEQGVAYVVVNPQDRVHRVLGTTEVLGRGR